MEYIEARKSFPCFDEPGFRSVYSMTIIHDETLKAWSNMPIKSSTAMYLIKNIYSFYPN
jgi:aminopeptidase N